MKRFLAVLVLSIVLSVLCTGCFSLPFSEPDDTSTDDSDAQLNDAQLTEVQALECYEDLFNMMPPELLIMTDAEIKQSDRDGIKPFWLGYLADEVASGSLDDLDLMYISELEKNELEKIFGPAGYYSVYSLSDIQETCDAVWGAGRLSTYDWPSSDWSFHTESGYIFAMQGYGDRGDIFYRDIAEVYTYGEVVVVSVHWLVYNTFMSEVHDMATGKKLAENLELPQTVSFDDLLDAIDTSSDKLGVLEMVFYMTEDGVRLWGTFPQGHISYPE
jgi:hypothetical protein